MCNLILKMYACGHRENTGEFELCHFARRVGAVCVGVTGVCLCKIRTCCEQCYDPDLAPNVDSPAFRSPGPLYARGKHPEARPGLEWSEFFSGDEQNGPGSNVSDSGGSWGAESEPAKKGKKKKQTGIFGRPGAADLLQTANGGSPSVSVSGRSSPVSSGSWASTDVPQSPTLSEAAASATRRWRLRRMKDTLSGQQNV